MIILLLIQNMLQTYGQIKSEVQFGGSNFLGITLNTGLDIPLSKNGYHFIVPIVGVGILLPGWDVPTCIIHAGLNYNYKKWGLGAEVSGFTENPFWDSQEHTNSSFVDMIIYPNANYTILFKRRWYLKVSAGAYFAFSKQYDNETDRHRMQFEGDVIPGAGLSLGYAF